MDKRDTRPKRTVLRPALVNQRLRCLQFVPCAALAPFCSIAWTLDWTFDSGEQFDLDVLPDPSVILVLSTAEPAHALGIVKGAFSVTLLDTGFVYGLKFKPAGFHPFCPNVGMAA